MAKQTWEEVVAAKKASLPAIPSEWQLSESLLEELARNESQGCLHIPAASGILSQNELELTENYTATELVQLMAQGKITSHSVTLAFCKRAAIAQQITCCLTETFFDRALDRAGELDDYREKNGKPVGPLHGLPISIKDCFNVEGIASTIGFVSFIEHGAAEKSSSLVDILLELGAVLYVKTNLPQTIMTADTENNIFGRTLNPHNRALTAGGSSGGEGALIALRGSLLGVGTDIAGSVRIPALCCGVYGFKPTLDRVPYGGQANPARAGMAGIAPSAGPLSNSPEDIELFLTAVCNSNPWRHDETALPYPWRDVEEPTSLRIGLLLEDPHHPLHPPTLRTMRDAVKALEGAGHTVLPLSGLPSIHAALKMAFHFFGMDPAGTPFQHIANSGEPRIPSIAKSLLPTAEWIDPTIENLYDTTVKRDMFKVQARRIIVENEVDVILMPGNAGPASSHDTYGLPPYTVFLNFLDYPACVLPYGTANELLDRPFVRDVRYVPAYQPSRIVNAPCSVQVVGKPGRDEELLAAVKRISLDLRA